MEGVISIDTDALKNRHQSFFGLDHTVLLFLHRASDFINMYSEVALITGLFAFEVQFNITYDQIRTYQGLPHHVNWVSLHDKIDILQKDGIIGTSDYQLLMDLKEVRNRLAHAGWNKLESEMQKESIISRWKMSNSHFIAGRLSHIGSIFIIMKIINTIMTLHEIWKKYK